MGKEGFSPSQEHDPAITDGQGNRALAAVSAVFPARALDLSGRCCGRKPLFYKRPAPHHFCTRCDGQFGPDGQQQQNWAWKHCGDGFVATYPEQEAAQSVARLFAVMAAYPAPNDGVCRASPPNPSQEEG